MRTSNRLVGWLLIGLGTPLLLGSVWLLSLGTLTSTLLVAPMFIFLGVRSLLPVASEREGDDDGA